MPNTAMISNTGGSQASHRTLSPSRSAVGLVERGDAKKLTKGTPFEVLLEGGEPPIDWYIPEDFM